MNTIDYTEAGFDFGVAIGPSIAIILRRLIRRTAIQVGAMCVTVAVGFCAARTAQAEPHNHLLAGEIHSLIADVRTTLKEDPRVQGKHLALGAVMPFGKESRKSNFGMEIERVIRSDLADLIDENSDITLAGSYRLDSGTNDNAALEVLFVKLEIRDKHDKVVQPFEREVNNSDDILRVLAVPSALPKTTDISKRNEAVRKAVAAPGFEVQDDFRISAKGQPRFAVGIKTRTDALGVGSPVKPQNMGGLAFVNIGLGEFYEIELTNTSNKDAVATVDVDGLDTLNMFASEQDDSGKTIHWPGYVVPKGQTVSVKGWFNTTKKTGNNDNVFAFAMGTLGQGAATAMKSRGAVGVINVQFREATDGNGEGLSRGIDFNGETEKGQGLKQDLTVKSVHIGESVISNVGIRYNRPAEQ